MMTKRKNIKTLSAIRKAMGFTQKEIGELCGVSQGIVNQFENKNPACYAKVYLALFYGMMAKEVRMDNALYEELMRNAKETYNEGSKAN